MYTLNLRRIDTEQVSIPATLMIRGAYAEVTGFPSLFLLKLCEFLKANQVLFFLSVCLSFFLSFFLSLTSSTYLL
jgi:hypothetical protein